MKTLRLVWNTVNDEVLLASLSGAISARFNGAGGEIFRALAANEITFEDVQSHYPTFYDSCDSVGLWKAPVADWSFTKFSEAHQLKRVQIELTRFCNLTCSYCYSSSGPTQKASLSCDAVFALLEDARELGCIWIDLTGGELLAYKYWREAVERATSLGLVTSIHSNGTLLSEEAVDSLSHFGISHLQVSLDSHQRSVHDKARGRAGAFDKSVAGIMRAKSAGIDVTVSIVAHRGNRDHYAEAVEFFQNELGVKVLMDRVIRAGSELYSDVGITTSEYYSLIAPLLNKKIGESKVCDNYVSNEFSIEPHCGVAHSFVYITAEGEFALCPTMTSRDDTKFLGPSIKDCSLRNAWLHHDYFQSYRNLNCRNTSKCPTAKECGGGCRSNAYIETGVLDAPDILSCNTHKNSSTNFVQLSALYGTLVPVYDSRH